MAKTQPDEYAAAEEVLNFHRNSDQDKRAEAGHHTLGRGQYQASPGNHRHDGTTSAPLFENVIVTGSRSTATASVLAQILTALSALGLQDATTP